jgi:phosphatidylglycerol---prolipoprotein diacylglyceryl transferase
VHPIAFNIGSFEIHWYGLCLVAAFVIGFGTASRRAGRDGLTANQILDAGTWLILGAIVGSRVFYVFSYWREQFADQPWTEVFMVRRGGLVFYGGLVGASTAIILYAWRKQLSLRKLADAFAPSIPLGYVFGRMGCLMTGCCYGQPTELPWAIHFPAGHATHGVGLHPTQIYDALLSLALYAALAWLYRRKKFDGQIFAVYLMGYAVSRALVEGFRGDYTPEFIHWGLTPAQCMGAAGLAVGALLYWKLPRPADRRV